MAKTPKTYDGVRTAVIAMVPDGVDEHTVWVDVAMCHAEHDGYTSTFQRWGASIDIEHDGIKINAGVHAAKSPADLIKKMQGELNRAIRDALEHKRLDLKQPRLEFAK